jgi:hypothetical protein
MIIKAILKLNPTAEVRVSGNDINHNSLGKRHTTNT